MLFSGFTLYLYCERLFLKNFNLPTKFGFNISFGHNLKFREVRAYFQNFRQIKLRPNYTIYP